MKHFIPVQVGPIPESRTPDWRDDAACVGSDPNLFGPWEPATEGENRRVAIAVQRCAMCPVIAQCHNAAEELGHAFGVWAGRIWSDGNPGLDRIALAQQKDAA